MTETEAWNYIGQRFHTAWEEKECLPAGICFQIDTLYYDKQISYHDNCEMCAKLSLLSNWYLWKCTLENQPQRAELCFALARGESIARIKEWLKFSGASNLI
jgi:hypothetical protein